MNTQEKLSPIVTRKMRRNLRRLCNMSDAEFFTDKFCRLFDGAVLLEGHAGPMIHIDRGAPILGVAHADVVLSKPCQIVDSFAFCPQLDDRLGIWTLLCLLPAGRRSQRRDAESTPKGLL